MMAVFGNLSGTDVTEEMEEIAAFIGPDRPEAAIYTALAAHCRALTDDLDGAGEAAYDAAVAAASHRSGDLLVQRQVGVMRQQLLVAGWALDGALALVGDDPAPSRATVLAVMAAKAEVARAGREVCDLAMEVAGGSAFFRGSVIERCYRDIRAARFHPLTPEQTLAQLGADAVGAPPAPAP